MLASLLLIPQSLFRHRYLVAQLSWREIAGRYRGSVIGLLWSFLNPLLMLTLYTLVFGVIFQTRWAAAGRAAAADAQADYALILFVGLILHGFLAECLNRAPALVLGNVNLVKRVVFPLEVLGWSAIAAALFHAAISFAVLVAAVLVLHGGLPWTIVLLPLVLAPLALMALGAVWALAAVGVFFRDIGQAVPPLTTLLLFLSPILFPAAAMPAGLRWLVALNPLSIPVEQARALAIWGTPPDWSTLALYSAMALLVAWSGAHLFRRSRPAFADVL
jgi:lipopolysaccharide transport system permease protein